MREYLGIFLMFAGAILLVVFVFLLSRSQARHLAEECAQLSFGQPQLACARVESGGILVVYREADGGIGLSYPLQAGAAPPQGEKK